MFIIVHIGEVYVFGRADYGRLGLGEDIRHEVKVPTPLPALKDQKCIHISTGTTVSMAVTDKGSTVLQYTTTVIVLSVHSHNQTHHSKI